MKIPIKTHEIYTIIIKTDIVMKGIFKIKEYYPDHTDSKGIFGMVDIKAVKTINKTITLKEIKQNSSLKEMKLVRQSRLSVSPVRMKEWEIILKMCETTL